MCSRLVAIVYLTLASFAGAQGVDRVTALAQADLEKAMRSLASLRETIKAAKVPLATELSGLEEKLTAVRSTYEQASRLLDTRNLDVNNLRNELKARQDENTYLGNVLAEFVLGLEGRIDFSERQRYAAIITAAKQAPTNDNLTVAQKFEKQVDVLKLAATRLEDLVGGARFDGEAVDPEGTVQKGKFALIGPVALFSTPDKAVAGIALPQTGGSIKPLVRPLDEIMNPGIAAIATLGEGLLPFDPSRGAALKDLMNRGSLYGHFKKGGPIMWPLLVCSILAVSIVIERLVFLLFQGLRRSPKARDRIFDALESGDIEGAAKVSASSKDYIARLLTYALNHREKSLTDGLNRAAGLELHRYQRGIVLMETIITLAPLLGLLGTIVGMMASFGMLGGGELSSPGAITGGIAEALIATAAGLGIAITCVIPMNWLVAKGEQAKHEIEDACTHCELLGKPLVEVEAQLAQKPAKPVPAVASEV